MCKNSKTTKINLLCALSIGIGAILFGHYYTEYIKPTSITIGNPTEGNYKELDIKEYLQDEDVLFSQNINNITFSIKDGVATYECIFAPIDFDATTNNYIVYVNNYMLSTISATAGTISGIHNVEYVGADNKTLENSNISIQFASYTSSSVLRVTLDASQLPLLMRYFQYNDFIITLAKMPYTSGATSNTWDDSSLQKQLTIELPNETINIKGYYGNLVELPIVEDTEDGKFDGWAVLKGFCENLTDTNFEFANSNCTIKPIFVNEYVYDGNNVDTSWYNENQNTYVIDNGQQLFAINKLMEEGVSFKNKTIELSNNILIKNNEEGYVESINVFEGIFDAKNYTIKYDLDETVNKVAIFKAATKNITIKNLNYDISQKEEKYITKILFSDEQGTSGVSATKIIIDNCHLEDMRIKGYVGNDQVVITNSTFNSLGLEIGRNCNVILRNCQAVAVVSNGNLGTLSMEDCVIESFVCDTNFSVENNFSAIIIAKNSTFKNKIVNTNSQGSTIRLTNCNYKTICEKENKGTIDVQ